MYPLANPHPTGQANPITFRADAILLAAGAWDADPEEIPVIAFDQVSLYFAYERGAVGGVFDWYIEYSPYSIDQVGVENWFQMSLYEEGVMVISADITSNVQRELMTYGSTGAGVETFIYGQINLKQTVERMRIFARESGDVDNPGTLQIIGVGNAES